MLSFNMTEKEQKIYNKLVVVTAKINKAEEERNTSALVSDGYGDFVLTPLYKDWSVLVSIMRDMVGRGYFAEVMEEVEQDAAAFIW